MISGAVTGCGSKYVCHLGLTSEWLAGARFEKGTLVERPDESEGDQQVA